MGDGDVFELLALSPKMSQSTSVHNGSIVNLASFTQKIWINQAEQQRGSDTLRSLEHRSSNKP